MEPIPQEWIDKLFSCMSEWYGERWNNIYPEGTKFTLGQTIWKSGLVGLSYDEIKAQLVLFKRHAQDPIAQPPHVMEFYRHAKRKIDPVVDYHPNVTKRGNLVLAKEHLDIIKKKFNL